MAEPFAAQTICATSVAGGQSSTSQDAATADSAFASASDAASPFIFQFPAASLRIMPSKVGIALPCDRCREKAPYAFIFP